MDGKRSKGRSLLPACSSHRVRQESPPRSVSISLGAADKVQLTSVHSLDALAKEHRLFSARASCSSMS